MEALRKFICDRCGETCATDWTEEQTLAEMRARYGEVPPERRLHVCDECYAVYIAAYNLAMAQGRFTQDRPS